MSFLAKGFENTKIFAKICATKKIRGLIREYGKFLQKLSQKRKLLIKRKFSLTKFC
jgi:N-glycosylase/DNA lyase